MLSLTQPNQLAKERQFIFYCMPFTSEQRINVYTNYELLDTLSHVM